MYVPFFGHASVLKIKNKIQRLERDPRGHSYLQCCSTRIALPESVLCVASGFFSTFIITVVYLPHNNNLIFTKACLILTVLKEQKNRKYKPAFKRKQTFICGRSRWPKSKCSFTAALHASCSAIRMWYGV